jgi:hypothetical protein
MRFRAAAVAVLVCAALGLAGCSSSYKPDWELESVAPDGESITILVAETCGGDAKFDHAEFADTDGGLVVTIINREPWGGCDSDLQMTRYEIDLPRPLGDDEIIQACWDMNPPPGCYKD